MKTKTVDYGTKGITITETDDDGNSKPVETLEYSETIADPVKRIEALREGEAGERKAHRGAMGFILEALQTSFCTPYCGKGLVTETTTDPDTGDTVELGIYRGILVDAPEGDVSALTRAHYNAWAKAFREACDAVMLPALREAHKGDDAKARAELQKRRSGGSFAVAASKARRFFYFTGKLPCAYTSTDNADVARALSVSAMDKVMGLIPEQPGDEDTFSARMCKMIQAWEKAQEKNPDDINALSALHAYLEMFTGKVETRAAHITAASSNAHLGLNLDKNALLPAPSAMTPEAIDAEIAALID